MITKEKKAEIARLRLQQTDDIWLCTRCLRLQDKSCFAPSLPTNCKTCTAEMRATSKAKSPDGYKSSYRRSTKNWKAAHPEHTNHMQRIADHKRDQGAIGTHTYKEWCALVEQTGSKCVRCDQPGDAISLTIDNIVPISKGGTNNIDNIQPLCKSCNSKKYTQTIDYRDKEHP